MSVLNILSYYIMNPFLNSNSNDNEQVNITVNKQQADIFGDIKLGLQNLSDLALVDLKDGETICYDSASAKFKNKITSGGTLAKLSDVSLDSNLRSYQTLQYDGVERVWRNVTIYL